MSAVLQEKPTFRPMRPPDVDAVLAVERTIYAHPWTTANFRDSLQAGYSCWIMECAGYLIGYGVVMPGVKEAHLLNLSIVQSWQRRGHGRHLLEYFIRVARGWEAERMLLEVRPSNAAARSLYEGAGFRAIAVRREYYPVDGKGREDAVLMALDL